MKKIFFLTVVLFLLVLHEPNLVFAATAAPTAEYVDPYIIGGCDPKLPDKCHVPKDIINASYPLSKTTQIGLGLGTSISQFVGQTAESLLNWAGLVVPLKEYNVGTNLFEAFGKQADDATKTDLAPRDFQKAEIPDINDKKFSSTGCIQVIDPQTGKIVGKFLSQETIETADNIQGYQENLNGSRKLSANFGGGRAPHDMRTPNLGVKKADESICGANTTGGDLLDQLGLDFIKQHLYGDPNSGGTAITDFTFTIVADIIKAFTNKDGTTSYEANLPVPAKNSIGGLVPLGGNLFCDSVGCPDMAKLDPIKYITDSQKKQLQKDGGWTNDYRPNDYPADYKSARDSAYDSQTFHETITNEDVTTTTYQYGLAGVQAGELYANCAMAPLGSQRYVDLGCAPSPTPAGECPIDQIAAGTFKPADASCKLGHTDLFKGFVQGAQGETAEIPDGLPPLAQKVLEAASGTYGVPPSILLATMINEGAFLQQNGWKWTDENVKTFSNCKKMDPMPNCQANAARTSQGATGPFGFLMISSDWNNPAVQGAVFKAFPNRPKTNLSACNFVDAAFGAAEALSAYDSHYIVDLIPPPNNVTLPDSCNGTKVYKGRDPATSCHAWSPERAALARMQYGDRQCDNTVDRTVDMYKQM